MWTDRRTAVVVADVHLPTRPLDLLTQSLLAVEQWGNHTKGHSQHSQRPTSSVLHWPLETFYLSSLPPFFPILVATNFSFYLQFSKFHTEATDILGFAADQTFSNKEVRMSAGSCRCCRFGKCLLPLPGFTTEELVARILQKLCWSPDEDVMSDWLIFNNSSSAPSIMGKYKHHGNVQQS